LQLFDHLQFSADLLKSRYSLVEMLLFMGRGKLNPYPGLAFRNNRVIKTRDINAFIKQTGCHLLLQSGVVKHHRTDGRLGGLDVKSGIHHLFQEVFSVEMQLILKFIGLCHHPYHPDAGSSNKRRY